jgi:hypothetical protein
MKNFLKKNSRIFQGYSKNIPKISHKSSKKPSGYGSCYLVCTLVLQNKFMTLMLFILLRFIVWPTSLIWWSKHCRVCLWWCTMKNYYNVCIPILHIHLRGNLEFTKLVNIMTTKGNEILQNVKTRMLNLTKRIMVEYTTFLVNMALDNLTYQQAMLNYEHLCDLQLCLDLFTFCHYLNFACFHQVFTI